MFFFFLGGGGAGGENVSKNSWLSRLEAAKDHAVKKRLGADVVCRCFMPSGWQTIAKNRSKCQKDPERTYYYLLLYIYDL